MSPHKLYALPSIAALAQYDISENGFLPSDPPLSRLPNAYYEPWERIVEQLARLIDSQRIRRYVDAMPILETLYLDGAAQWQRAYSILAIIAQGYIWTGPEPSEHLPPCISVPFITVAEHLEVNPVATYAALNLWNWRPLAENLDLCQPENLEALHTATGTEDESWFFIISNAMEARAGPLIKILLGAIAAVERNDADTVVAALEEFEKAVQEIGRLLERMDERCNPQIFFHNIRPFLAGSMNMEAAGLPKGVFFDEGEGRGSWRKYRGGSNGQSSLLQFFDAVLSVQHSRQSDFHAEMRRYMPGPHARFIDDVESIANIRSFVDASEDNTELVAAFNRAVAALTEFRDKHIALVTRYIVIPSRQKAPTNAIIRRDLASAATKMAAEQQTQELVGTGGTKLIPFLRETRDETSNTTVFR